MKKNKLEYLSLILILVEFIVMVLVSGFTINSMLKSMSSNYAKSLINQTKQAVNTEMQKPITVGQAIACYPTIIAALEDEDEIDKDIFISKVRGELENIEYNLGERYKIYLISDSSRRYVTSKGLNKVIDVENDEHDIWYSMFLERGGNYSMDIDTDQSDNNAWTAFVNCRVEDSDKGYLGCLAVAYDMTNVQELFKKLEETYSVSIVVYDAERNRIVDSKRVNESVTLYSSQINNETHADVFEMKSSGFSAFTYLESLGWWIEIRDEEAVYSHFYTRLIVYLIAIFAVIIVVMSYFTAKIMKKESNKATSTAHVEGMGSLSSIYYSMHLIDLEEDTYITFKSAGKMEIIEAQYNGLKAREVMKRSVELCFSGEGLDLESVSKFCDLNTLDERLDKRMVISREFLSNEGIWFRLRFIVKDYDKEGRISRVIFATENIDEQKKYESELKELSETDMLTGITNRGHGELLLEDMFLKKQPGTMLMMDGDSFKSINDTYGHDAGDEVIRAIARTLKASFGKNDIVMRLGGDEFAAYIYGVNKEEEVKALVDAFINNLENLNIPEIRGQKIQISIGAAMYDGSFRTNFENMYKKADKLLYLSKLQEGSFCTYDRCVKE